MKLPFRPASLRWRLLLGTLLWASLTVALAAWGLTGLFRQHVTRALDAELTLVLDRLASQASVDAEGRLLAPAPLGDPRLERPLSGHYWQVDRMTPPAATLARSRSLWDQTLKVPLDRPPDGEVHRHTITGPQQQRLRVVERSIQVSPDGDQPGPALRLRLLATAPHSVLDEPLAAFSRMLWLSLAVLALSMAVGAGLQVWVGLAPLRTLRAGLARVHAGTSRTLDIPMPQEIKPLVDDFNRVLSDNAAMLERARAQAGNLAHALKTPLTVLANAATQAGTSGVAQDLVQTQVALARQQVDYHLARARAAHLALQGSVSELVGLTEGLVRAMRQLHGNRALQISLHAAQASASVACDAQDVQEMLGNLLDNACKWAESRVAITINRAGARWCVTIDDDGPGIAPAQRERVLARGVRADERTPGSGLGLAIVDDLVQAYGASLELAASPWGGLRVRLQFSEPHLP